MKTDKKKLMRKLIAVGLMASMLTANTMTYGSSLILPSINAEAFSAEAETKLASITKTFDISTLAENFVETPENGGVIRIDITENGTYKFTGTNYKTDGGCYIDVQVTVPAGVEANFIFDDCTIVNNIADIYLNCGETDLADEYNTPFVINGTVNVYVKSASELFMNNKYESNAEARNIFAESFSGLGTVNIMESENRDAVLTLSSIETGELNINGGILDAYSIFSPKLAINDGTVYLSDSSIQETVIHNSDYKPVNSLKYTGGNAFLIGELTDGSAPYSWFANIGADKQITDLNGTKLKQTYSVNRYGGSLIAYIAPSHFSADNAPYIVAGGELLVFTDLDDEYFDTSVNLGDPAALKITKEYDGTTGFDNQTIETITMNGHILTPDLSAVNFTGIDVGEYTAKVPFTFTDNSTAYTFYYSVPVEITAAPLTVSSVTVEDKVYDGTTTATVKEVVFDGLAETDKLVLGTDYTVTAAFEDEKAGTDKAVNVTVTLKDTAVAKNYIITAAAPITAKANITAKELTIKSATVADKTYDGTTDATVTAVELDGAIAGEKVDYTATAKFTDAAAGKGKEVTVTVTLKDSTYTLTESKFTAKADINFAGKTDNVSYESVADKPSLPKADDFVNKDVDSEGLLVVKSPKTETRDYYFAYLVKSEKFKIGNAAPKKGTFYVALNDKGEKTRKFTVSIPFTTVIIDGKTYKAPDGYAYYAFGITDVPTKYDLHCSENIELN